MTHFETIKSKKKYETTTLIGNYFCFIDFNLFGSTVGIYIGYRLCRNYQLVLSDQRLNERSFLPLEEQQIARVSTENAKPEIIPDKVDGVKIEKEARSKLKRTKKTVIDAMPLGNLTFRARASR